MKDVAEDEPWNLYWTDLSISPERCKEMRRFQASSGIPSKFQLSLWLSFLNRPCPDAKKTAFLCFFCVIGLLKVVLFAKISQKVVLFINISHTVIF